MNSYRMTVLLIGLLGLLPGSARALSLDEALVRAESAPEIQGIAANEAATRELEKAADALPDPRLVLSVDDYMLEGASRHRLDASKRMVGIMQTIPAGAKREAARQKALAANETAARQRDFVRRDVRREATLLWLKLYFLQRKEAVLQARIDETKRRENATSGAFAAGGGARPALDARLDLQMLEDALDLLRRDAELARVKLARWTGPLAPDETASGELPVWATETAQSEEEADDDAPRESGEAVTELRASAAKIDLARADFQQALADRKSDWSVELGWGQDAMGDAMMMAKVGVSLPFFTATRQTPRIEAARHRLTAAEAEHAARRADFARQRAELLAEESALASLIERLETATLPLLDKKAELAAARYAGGSGEAAELLMAREATLAARLRAIDLTAERAAVRARLHFLRQRAGDDHE
ncbi:MAG: TolC family protein [Azoarcus sp.]|jgi:outer membrane protein TolC|nr:TolC family protein [Azoarcus sp.]